MRLLTIFTILVAPCFATGPQFNSWQFNYSAPGTNTVTATVNTGSGSGYGCVLFWFNRGGSLGTPSCGGHAMSAVGMSNALGAACASATSQQWVYFGTGVAPGSVVVSGVQTGGIDNVLVVFIVDGAGASQPDATSALAMGNFSTITGGSVAAMTITTVSANAFVMGEYCPGQSLTTTPSSNATYAGTDGIGFGVFYWYSTSNPASAGSYSLLAKTVNTTTAAYNADGISIGMGGTTYKQKGKVLGFGH